VFCRCGLQINQQLALGPNVAQLPNPRFKARYVRQVTHDQRSFFEGNNSLEPFEQDAATEASSNRHIHLNIAQRFDMRTSTLGCRAVIHRRRRGGQDDRMTVRRSHRSGAGKTRHVQPGFASHELRRARLDELSDVRDKMWVGVFPHTAAPRVAEGAAPRLTEGEAWCPGAGSNRTHNSMT
jgi:hypothetical protein